MLVPVQEVKQIGHRTPSLLKPGRLRVMALPYLPRQATRMFGKIITTAHSVPGLDMRIHSSLLLRDDLDYVLLSEHPVSMLSSL